MKRDKAYYYRSETLNIWTHGFGAIAFFVASIYLVIRASDSDLPYAQFSTIIFGCSLIVLYVASTRYHWAKRVLDERTRRFQMYDHLGIYYLIAGSYTPYVLMKMSEGSGWRIFFCVWIIALIGTVYKLWFKAKFKWLSLFLYIAMGWIIIFDYHELKQSVSPETINLLTAGGCAYSIGTFFYATESIPYNHPIWHLFVLAGSAFHFWGVLTLL